MQKTLIELVGNDASGGRAVVMHVSFDDRLTDPEVQDFIEILNRARRAAKHTDIETVIMAAIDEFNRGHDVKAETAASPYDYRIELRPEERTNHNMKDNIVEVVEKDVDGCGTDVTMYVALNAAPSCEELFDLKRALREAKGFNDCDSSEDMLAEAVTVFNREHRTKAEIIPAPFQHRIEF